LGRAAKRDHQRCISGRSGVVVSALCHLADITTARAVIVDADRAGRVDWRREFFVAHLGHGVDGMGGRVAYSGVYQSLSLAVFAACRWIEVNICGDMVLTFSDL